MLLGDVTASGGPVDPFKINRIRKINEKAIPEKVTQVNHFNNEKLQSSPSP